jgi:hypothetical protein
MENMKRLFTILFLGGSLLWLNHLNAQPQRLDDRHDRRDEHRYYDGKRRDYHEWNDREARAYRMYWQQRRRNYIDWERANERQRRDYWNWRHSHSDSVLRINIR